MAYDTSKIIERNQQNAAEFGRYLADSASTDSEKLPPAQPPCTPGGKPPDAAGLDRYTQDLSKRI